MSDIFQEVDEEVRRDKAAEFWKKYQNVILAGAVVIVLASAGFRYWQYERERATQAAGDQFQQALTALEAGKFDEAKAGLDKIATTGPSGYRALAQMTVAGAEAAKDPQAAISAFDAISGDATIDPLLRDTARLRAALLRVDIPGEQQKGEAALTALSAPGGPYRRMAALALGALAIERKDYDDASKQFDLVLGDPEASPDERQAASRWLGLIASNRSPAAAK
ncbi:MAG: tetratricopeptide repeat protein [Hyphomicrobiales bacterium]|nr:tetratricopeptide repeat protein [Hyphomicrobiales bacterium]